MTATSRHRPPRRTPWTVHLVRLLVAVEVLFACAAALFVGFFTVVGLFLSLSGFGGDGRVDVAGVVLGLLVGLALLALLAAFVRSSVTAGKRLYRDRVRARTTLVRLQWIMLAGLLLAAPITDDWVGLGFVSTPVPMLTLLGCGAIALPALQRLRAANRDQGR